MGMAMAISARMIAVRVLIGFIVFAPFKSRFGYIST
jgi:hypothetical protein